MLSIGAPCRAQSRTMDDESRLYTGEQTRNTVSRPPMARLAVAICISRGRSLASRMPRRIALRALAPGELHKHAHIRHHAHVGEITRHAREHLPPFSRENRYCFSDWESTATTTSYQTAPKRGG